MIMLHTTSLLIGGFFGLMLGLALAFYVTRNDFSTGWDSGYKWCKEYQEKNENIR